MQLNSGIHMGVENQIKRCKGELVTIANWSKWPVNLV